MRSRTQKRKFTAISFNVKGRTVSAREILELIAKQPDQISERATAGLTINANPQILDWIRSTPLGQYVDAGGEVTTSALTGLEEALIVIALIALVSGAGVGYLKGYEDGYQDGQAAAQSSDDGDTGGDTGDDGGSSGDTGGESGGEGDRRGFAIAS